MAKKKNGVNKSKAIRDYLTANADAKPLEVVAAMKSKGIVVTAQFVSTTKSNMKKMSTRGKSPASTSSRKSAPAKRAPRKDTLKADGAISLDSLIKAKQLVEEMGGVEDARTALSALEQLMD